MKNILLAAIATLAMSAVSANAFDLGYGITAGGEVSAEYNVTAGGDVALTATPGLAYSVGEIDFSVSTDVDLTDIAFVGVDLGATYAVGTNIDLYADVSTNSDFEFGDWVIGATLSF